MEIRLINKDTKGSIKLVTEEISYETVVMACYNMQNVCDEDVQGCIKG